jgi:hypothetical protein
VRISLNGFRRLLVEDPLLDAPKFVHFGFSDPQHLRKPAAVVGVRAGHIENSTVEIVESVILRLRIVEVSMARRSFLRQMFALPLVGIASSWGQSSGHKQLNVMMKSAWG